MSRSRRRRLPAALALLLLPRVLGAQQILEDSWYTVLLGGVPVGSMHQRTSAEADGALRTELTQRMRIHRYGEPFTVRQDDIWLEQPGSAGLPGSLKSLRSRLDMNGQVQSLELRDTPTGLELSLQREGGEQRMHVDPGGPVLGPALTAGLLAGALQSSDDAEHDGEPLRYRAFSAETLSVIEVQVRLLGRGELRDSRGSPQRGVLAEERSSLLPGVVTQQVYGPAGRLLYSLTPLGLALEMIASLAGGAAAVGPVFEVATLAIPVEGLDRLKGPPQGLLTVSLRFTGPALEPLRGCLEAEPWPPEAVELMVGSDAGRSAGPPAMVVRLRRSPGPQALPAAAAANPAEVSRFSGDGFYLNLEDPRLARLLAGCAADRPGLPDESWLACLEKAVNRHLEHKSLDWGFAGVAEILSTRAGDCSEHALLLAALLRRSGVPARLAYGFLFTETGFVGHAWTEAWFNGAWRWLDPSFPGGHPYGLKLPLGVIDPAEPLGTQMGLRLLELAGGLQAELIDARFAGQEGSEAAR